MTDTRWFEHGRIKAKTMREALVGVLERYEGRLVDLWAFRDAPQPGYIEYLVELRSPDTKGQSGTRKGRPR